MFPTLPVRWHHAYFSGLRAEGAFLVTSKLIDGRVRFIDIVSESGKECVVRNPWDSGAVMQAVDSSTGMSAGDPLTLEGDHVRFATEPGGHYLLYPTDRKPDASDRVPLRFSRTENEKNYFGLKKYPRF